MRFPFLIYHEKSIKLYTIYSISKVSIYWDRTLCDAHQNIHYGVLIYLRLTNVYFKTRHVETIIKCQDDTLCLFSPFLPLLAMPEQAFTLANSLTQNDFFTGVHLSLLLVLARAFFVGRPRLLP